MFKEQLNYSKYNNYYGYNNCNYRHFNTTFANPYPLPTIMYKDGIYTSVYPNQEDTTYNVNNENKDNYYSDVDISNNNIKQETLDKNKDKESNEFRVGPISFLDHKLSLFEFSIELDDIIIVLLMIVLFLDSNCDYLLLIVLGLILFNINLGDLKLF